MDDKEVCDDGNNIDGDGCSADCTSNERCGNGHLDPGEQCDPPGSSCGSAAGAFVCDQSCQCRTPPTTTITTQAAWRQRRPALARDRQPVEQGRSVCL